ncbi:hypothetical protein ACFUTU_10875 [Arthrobacter sp. NPDC057388]|uniref:hypothetical protein n=1 Tax=Arthrobacter sp. NPDC057388 TaxID=3346116 RepID=UPI00363732DD
MTMVNQKSDGFRSLTGFHGGLRRGTAAAAFGAVLVLSAGVPASNAATSELPASGLLGDSEQTGSGAGTGLEATVDAAGLEAWAAAALSNERDSRDEPAPSGPAPSDSPSETPSESPSVPPSLAPLVPAPVPSMTISASPTPAVPVPSPSDPITSGPITSYPVPSVPVPSVPVPTTPVPVPSQPIHTDPAPSPAPASPGTAKPASPAAPPPTSEETAPAGMQTPSATPSQSGSWTGSSTGNGSSSVWQPPAGQTPGGQALAGSVTGTGSQAQYAGGSAPAAGASSADTSPFKEITGLSGGSGLRGRSASGIAAGVWGSAQLAGPNNMATISSAYMRGPAENAVMSASHRGTIAPQVWWGAGLLAVAGAAGVAAVRLRRAL